MVDDNIGIGLLKPLGESTNLNCTCSYVLIGAATTLPEIVYHYSDGGKCIKTFLVY
jgi:hypothetical protein